MDDLTLFDISGIIEMFLNEIIWIFRIHAIYYKKRWLYLNCLKYNFKTKRRREKDGRESTKK